MVIGELLGCTTGGYLSATNKLSPQKSGPSLLFARAAIDGHLRKFLVGKHGGQIRALVLHKSE
jgi:hypothetical protein